MANKQERIAGIIRKTISETIQFKIKDPNLGFVSVTDVKVSNDISWATVYVSFFDKRDEKPSMAVLNRSKGFIRSEVAHRLDTRRCPDIRFEVDDGYEKEQRITELLNKAK